LSDSLPGLISRSEQFLHSALSDEELRDSVMAAWVSLEDRTIAELHEGLGDVQLQEFVVLGYEFWLQFRKTGYFENCARAVVSHLFDKYGERPLTDLLGDMGVSREVVMAEIDAYAIPVIDVLREEGYVEALVRRRLAPFYKSAAARKILQQEA
jgi:DNA-binding transcriptional ArsR family regulator